MTPLRALRIKVLCSLAVLLLWASAGTVSAQSRTDLTTALQPVRVQLSGLHKAQFAGFYLAVRQGYFAQEGLQVILEEPDLTRNLVDPLTAGKVDVAVLNFVGAVAGASADNPITHIAQIIQGQPLILLCRVSAGVVVPADIIDKPIAVSSETEGELFRRLLKAITRTQDLPHAPGRFQPALIPSEDKVAQLRDGQAACVTGTALTDYAQALRAGITKDDLIVIRPDDYGAIDLSDGLYVQAKRLESAAFRQQMVGLLRALRRGWDDAHQYPSAAMEAVLAANPRLNVTEQRESLEAVLPLIPANHFGLFDLQKFDQLRASLVRSGTPTETLSTAWTHGIWVDMQAQAQAKQERSYLQRLLFVQTDLYRPATRHYLGTIAASNLFRTLLAIGIFAFALSGTLLAIDLGYGVWGRLVLAMVTCMGGGFLRDLLIGPARQPFYFLTDPLHPGGAALVVVVTSILVRRYRGFASSPTVTSIRVYVEMLGFALIAVNGALIAVLSGLDWIWVPLCAALSCTGGGTLRDVLINREPGTFRGNIYEEVAVMAGLVLVGGLLVANRYEYSLWPVILSLLAAIGMAIGARFWLYRSKPQLPAWLAGKPAKSG